MAAALDATTVPALEINLSCPNLDGVPFALDASLAGEIVHSASGHLQAHRGKAVLRCPTSGRSRQRGCRCRRRLGSHGQHRHGGGHQRRDTASAAQWIGWWLLGLAHPTDHDQVGARYCQCPARAPDHRVRWRVICRSRHRVRARRSLGSRHRLGTLPVTKDRSTDPQGHSWYLTKHDVSALSDLTGAYEPWN